MKILLDAPRNERALVWDLHHILLALNVMMPSDERLPLDETWDQFVRIRQTSDRFNHFARYGVNRHVIGDMPSPAWTKRVLYASYLSVSYPGSPYGRWDIGGRNLCHVVYDRDTTVGFIDMTRDAMQRGKTVMSFHNATVNVRAYYDAAIFVALVKRLKAGRGMAASIHRLAHYQLPEWWKAA